MSAPDRPVWRRLALGRGGLDRAGHRRSDPDWLAAAWKRAAVLVVDERSQVLVTGPRDARRLVLLDAADVEAAGLAEAPRYFLGLGLDPDLALDGDEPVADGLGSDALPYFVVPAPLPARADARPGMLYTVGADLPGDEAGVLAEAVGLLNWHRDYRFSPLTGAPLSVGTGGWEGHPADGSAIIYPRTNPAIIVLVHDGVAGDEGRCLLTRQASWDTGRFSCVAGFVEPGESAEAAVHREVAEETAIRLDGVTYRASQAWPLPASLMLGFHARADSSQQVVVDPVELEDARWFTRGELRGHGPGEQPGLPGPLSIAHELVTGWRDETLP